MGLWTSKAHFGVLCTGHLVCGVVGMLLVAPEGLIGSYCAQRCSVVAYILGRVSTLNDAQFHFLRNPEVLKEPDEKNSDSESSTPCPYQGYYAKAEVSQ